MTDIKFHEPSSITDGQREVLDVLKFAISNPLFPADEADLIKQWLQCPSEFCLIVSTDPDTSLYARVATRNQLIDLHLLFYGEGNLAKIVEFINNPNIYSTVFAIYQDENKVSKGRLIPWLSRKPNKQTMDTFKFKFRKDAKRTDGQRKVIETLKSAMTNPLFPPDEVTLIKRWLQKPKGYCLVVCSDPSIGLSAKTVTKEEITELNNRIYSYKDDALYEKYPFPNEIPIEERIDEYCIEYIMARRYMEHPAICNVIYAIYKDNNGVTKGNLLPWLAKTLSE